MRSNTSIKVGACALFIAIALFHSTAEAQQRRGMNGAQQQQMLRQQQITMAQQLLAQGQMALAAADADIAKYQGEISEATGNIEGAKKTMDEAKTSTSESRKSLKTIEADILAAQEPTSEYGRASAAFLKAQDEMKTAKESAVGNDAFAAQKAAVLKDGGPVKAASFERETLANNPAYQQALDKAKAAKITADHIKNDLFKANADWSAATAAAREAAAEEAKAKSQATKGAVKKAPATKNLHEAEASAETARAMIAQATAVLQQFNAMPKQAAGKKR
jgi:hypothetical protein